MQSPSCAASARARWARASIPATRTLPYFVLPLAADANNSAALFYIVRRGKGNASVFAWAYVSIWSAESFAEPGFEVEPEFLSEFPVKRRQGIEALRRSSVHEYAFLTPGGEFSADHIEFRPELQVIGWPAEALRNDVTAVLVRCRQLVGSLPAADVLARLLYQRRGARRTFRSEASAGPSSS